MTRLPELRPLARVLAVAGLALAALAAAPARAATITLSDSPASVTSQSICPRANGAPATAIPVNAFQVVADVAPSRVDRVEVRFIPAGSYANIERVEIRSADGQTLYGAAPPTADRFWINLSVPLPVTASNVTYLVTATPREHQAMPPPSMGRALASQIQVVSVLTNAIGNSAVGSDLVSATLTIDNGSPANVTWAGITAGANNIRLDWTGVPDPTVLVLRREIGPVEDVPVEGTSAYAVGAFPGGTSRVAYSQAGPDFNDLGDAGTGLVGGRPYYYRVFAKDACDNYSAGTSLGPIFPGGSGEGDLALLSTKPVVGILNPGNGPVTRPFKVQIRVFSPGTVAISEVRLYGNNGAGDVLLGTTAGGTPAIVENTAYEAGTPDPASGIYEFTADTTRLPATGTWTLRAWASNTGTGQATTEGVYSGGVGVVVSSNVGDGRLLVRDNSSQLCSDCHQVKTHSSEATGNDLGSWYVGCRSCHAPHGTTNAKLIAKEITPPSVNGAQAPQPVFYTGVDGNVAGGKANADGTGLCQVCHVRTSVFTRVPSAEDATHGQGGACGSCHKHTEGQKASCTSCHGDKNRTVLAGADSLATAAPPVAAAPVGGNDIGAHQAHVNRATFRRNPLGCAECHTLPNSHQGAADALSWGGIAGLARREGSSPAWDSGTATCSGVYCHGGSTVNPYGGANVAPSWTAATTLTCGSCHGAPPSTTLSDGSTHPADSGCETCHGTGYLTTGIVNAALDTHIDGTLQAQNCTGCHGTAGVNGAPPARATPATTSTLANAVGKHQVHVTGTTFRAQALACGECHVAFPAGHRDNVGTVGFGTLGTDGSTMAAAYQGFTTPATPTCTTTYCHAGAAGGSAAAPNWATGAAMNCASCHGNAPAYPHPQNMVCADCHPGVGAEIYSRTSPTAGTVVKGTHVDRTVNRNATGCASCHGALGTSGVTLVANTTSAAPGFDAGSKDVLGATSSLAIGAHQRHLGSAALRSVGAADCGDCHTMPLSDTDTVHATGSGPNGSRATVVMTAGFGATGGRTPAYAGSNTATTNNQAGTCSATYCHGAYSARGANYVGSNVTPGWTQTTAQASACGTCHLAPPNTPAHDSARAGSSRSCADCHTGYNCTADTLSACLPMPAAHLDGTFQAPAAMTCTSCHGTLNRVANTTLGTLDSKEDAAPPRDAAFLLASNQVGPHQAHVNPASAGQIFRPMLCSECHGAAVDSYTTSHANAATDVSFPAGGTARSRAFPAATSAGNPYGCATYCHNNPATNGGGGSVGTWAWNTTTAATCASCHGMPPTGPAHVSVGTNQPATACYACHNTTVTSGGAIAFTGAGASATTVHLDGAATTGGISCHSCHGSVTNDAPPVAANGANGNAVGAHQSHVTAGNIANGIACTVCHGTPAVSTMNHANGTVNVAFTGTAASGTQWNLSTGPAASNCSTSACHGGAATQSQWGRLSADPRWNTVDGSFQQCTSCHGNPPPLNAATHHPPNTTTACTVCHGAGYASPIVSPALGTHVDGTINYRAGCTGCHGDTTLTGALASNNAAAPGFNANAIDISGATSGARVGAHAAHLSGTRLRTTLLACSECHTVPGDLTHADGAGNSTGARANVNLPGSLANGTFAGGTNTNPSYSSPNCSSVYCHGARYVGRAGYTGTNMAPTWTQTTAQAATCGTCHAAAPTAGATHNAANAGTEACSVCHTTYVNCTKSNNFATCQIPVEHLNGTFDAPAGGCGMCHGNPPATIALTAPFVGATHPQNPVCGSCHGAGYNTTDYASLPGSHGGTTVPGTDGPRNGCTACHGVLAGPTAAAVTDNTLASNAPGYWVGGTTFGADSAGSTATSYTAVGAHDAHVRKTNLRNAALACTQCHFGLLPASGNVSHSNGNPQTAFDPALAASGGAVTWNRSAATCSATYCHGNFTNGNDRITGGTPTTPGQVTGLSSPSQTQRSISLSWTAVTGAAMYKVERGTSATGPWAQIGTSTSTTYVDDGLWDGTTYWYRVRAWNTAATGDGTYSTVLTQATTGGGGGGPTARAYSWQWTSTGSYAGLTANLPALACGDTTYPTQTAARVTTMSSTANSCTMRLYTSVGGTANAPLLTIVLTTPYGAATAISAGSVVWSQRAAAATTVGVQLGYVQAGVFTGFGSPVQVNLTTTTVTAATTSLASQTGTVPSGASLALRYTRVTTDQNIVRFYFSATEGITNVTETPTGTPPALPSAPTGAPANPRITAAASTSLTVAWDPVTNASTYKVERSANGTSGWAQVAQPATTSVTDRGLAASTTYYYRVRASNPGGDAASYSANASGATTAAAPPGAISWTGGFSTTGTSLTCSSCHGSPPGGTHPANGACATCHPTYTATTVDTAIHMNGVIDVDCIGCHGSPQGSRREVVSEFGGVWSHKRSETGTTKVNKWDCIVCHMEGDPTTGDRVTGVHANGLINLRDPDSGNNINGVTWTGALGGSSAGSYAPNTTPMAFNKFTRNLGVLFEAEPATSLAALQAQMVNFCLKCHDANGATAFASGPLSTMPTTSGTRSAGKPFGQTIAGTNYVGGGGLTACATGTDGCVTNVAGSFATSNASYHPVLGRNNNSYVGSGRMRAPWNNTFTRAAGSTNVYGNLISCWDCHAPNGASGPQGLSVTAHGGASTLRAAVWVNNATNLCNVCHNTGASGNNHGTGSAFGSGGNSGLGTYLTQQCNVCHGSQYAVNGAARPIRGQDVHGFDSFARNMGTDTYWPVGANNQKCTGAGAPWACCTGAGAGSCTEANSGYKPYAFLRNVGTGGAWPAAVNAWKPLSGGTAPYTVPTGTATCGGNGTLNGTSACGNRNHSTYTPGGAF